MKKTGFLALLALISISAGLWLLVQAGEDDSANTSIAANDIEIREEQESSPDDDYYSQDEELDVFEDGGVIYDTTVVEIGGQTIEAEIAESTIKQRRGLSFRDGLNDGTGMLFVYSEPAVLKFWMKDMRFSLDIIWLNADKEIIYMEQDLSPDTFPESFGPAGLAQYVLEVNAGFADEHGVELGDTVDFSYEPLDRLSL